MKLRKEKWEDTLFGDAVECLEKHAKYPINEKYEKYIGLENLNENNLKIEGFGLISNGTTFSKIFSKGNVLFGKRRAYLKKTAVADFDGICSGDILVFRHKENVLLSDLLVIYVSSQSFINHAISTSAGSLSPRTRWKDLANYSFPLPPLEEQKQIAALFQSIETAMELVNGQGQHLLNLKNKLLKDLFSEKKQFGIHLKEKDFETVRFEKVATNISERVEPKKTELTFYVGLEHLDADNLKIERTGTPDDVIGTKLKIYKGDIIFGKRRAYLRKIAVSHFDGIASAHSMILRANEKLLKRNFSLTSCKVMLS